MATPTTQRHDGFLAGNCHLKVTLRKEKIRYRLVLIGCFSRVFPFLENILDTDWSKLGAFTRFLPFQEETEQ